MSDLGGGLHNLTAVVKSLIQLHVPARANVPTFRSCEAV